MKDRKAVTSKNWGRELGQPTIAPPATSCPPQRSSQLQPSLGGEQQQDSPVPKTDSSKGEPTQKPQKRDRRSIAVKF